MKHVVLIMLISVAACDSRRADDDKTGANIALASRYFTEVYNQGNVDFIDELFTEDYRHTNTEGREFNSREDLKVAVRRIEALLPNLTLDIEEAVADDEKAIFVIRMQSDLPGMASPSTKAKKTDFNETFIFWIRENKIYRGRSIGAHLPLVKQVSGFEGGLLDLIRTVSETRDTLGNAH